MAEIKYYRRSWQPDNKRKKGLKLGEDDYYISKEWQVLRRAFFGMVYNTQSKRYVKTKNLLCVACADEGYITESVVADHIVQRIMGGADSLENLQALCSKCHDRKSALESKKNK